MKSKISKALPFILALAAVFAVSYIGARIGTGAKSETTTEAEQAEPLEASQSIAIPGYDVIRLAAGQTQQSAYFYNPDSNTCFFIVSLCVDGAELYVSPMLAPNTQIENICLAEPLSAGFYDAVLMYSCYDLYTQKELNGAEIAVKLEVN